MRISVNPYSLANSIKILSDLVKAADWQMDAGSWGTPVTLYGTSNEKTFIELLAETGIEFTVVEQ